MPVDFFASSCTDNGCNCTENSIKCLEIITNQHFGITDEKGNVNFPARIDTSNPSIWGLTVTNNSSADFRFKAVDWCIPIFRTGKYDLNDDARTASKFSSDSENQTGSELIKRCEGFLLFDNKILFIEIKNWKNGKGGWIRDAREKFEETIISFREHHPQLADCVIEPILSNPSFHGLHPNEMIQKRILKDKIGLEFTRKNSISI